MKDCISMYLGGEIITPDLCDYDSYKSLGLKCPFCQAPVFLRQGSEYTRDEKIIKRESCFAHFKADMEQGELCEARATSKAGREEIEAMKRSQRDQRLRLYRRYFAELCFEKLSRKKKVITLLSNVSQVEQIPLKAHIDATYKEFCKTCLEVSQAGTALMHRDRFLSMAQKDFGEMGFDAARKHIDNMIFIEVINHVAENLPYSTFELMFYMAVERILNEISKIAAGDTRKMMHLNKFYENKEPMELFLLEVKHQLFSEIGYVAEGFMIVLCLNNWVEAIESIKSTRKGFGT